MSVFDENPIESIKEKPIILFEQPNYKARYDFFINEYVSFNLEIPDELKFEYNFLFEMFGGKNL